MSPQISDNQKYANCVTSISVTKVVRDASEFHVQLSEDGGESPISSGG